MCALVGLACRALSRLEAGLWELKEAPNFKHWMQRMLDNAHSRLRSFKGRELVHLLQALADIKWMPSQAWLASYSAIFRLVVTKGCGIWYKWEHGAVGCLFCQVCGCFGMQSFLASQENRGLEMNSGCPLAPASTFRLHCICPIPALQAFACATQRCTTRKVPTGAAHRDT